MTNLLPLLFATLSPDDRHALDAEVERMTAMDCDEAARTLSKKDFESVARSAVENIKKRKKGVKDPGQEVAAYA